MRILFVSPLGLRRNADYRSEKQVGAIEKQIIGLASLMSSFGHDTYIIRSWNDSPEIEVFKDVHLINIPRRSWKGDFTYRNSSIKALSTVITYFIYSLKIRRKIKEIRPDIINIPSHIIAYFLSNLKYAKVYTTHTHIWPDRRNLISKIELKMLSKFKRKGGVIVPLNKKIKQDLDNINIKTHNVIPNALNISQYNKDIDKGYILYSGRLLPHKGLSYLIKAFSQIENKYDTELLIVGSGPEERKLIDLANNLGTKKIDFKPFLPRSDYFKCLSNCSIFVLPSFDEMFGVVVIEAMASGKPVIASDIPGPQDIITHERDGFLFEKGNVIELKKYLEYLINNPELRKKIGEDARKTVELNYTFEKVAKKYIEVFKKLTE